MPDLAPVLPRLAKLMPLLGSPHAGEVAATAAAIGRLLSGAGASWHDLAGLLARSGEKGVLAKSGERAFAEAMAEAFRTAGQPPRSNARSGNAHRRHTSPPSPPSPSGPQFRTGWQAIDHLLDEDRSMTIADRERLSRIRAQIYGQPHLSLSRSDMAWLVKRWGMQGRAAA